MERLEKDLAHIKKDGIDSSALYRRVCKYLEELSRYKDAMPLERAQELVQADRDGRLVVLPVEPWFGPTQQNEMYIYENGEVWPIYVTGCEAGPNADGVFTVTYMTVDGDVFTADDIGKTVFLTRQEAEAAVEKMKGETDNELE